MEHHRKYFEEGLVSRDVVIVAHGHFNRVFIARWNKFPLHFGESFRGPRILGFTNENQVLTSTLNLLE